MRQVLKDQELEWPQRPEGIIGREICASLGITEEEGCTKRFEYFVKGTEPGGKHAAELTLTPQKTKMLIDKTNNQPAKEGSTEIEEREVNLISDPLTGDYCLDCEPYPNTIDITKITYRANILGVDQVETEAD